MTALTVLALVVLALTLVAGCVFLAHQMGFVWFQLSGAAAAVGQALAWTLGAIFEAVTGHR